MAPKLLDVKVNSQQLAKLKIKLENYPPYVIEQGLESVNTFLNDDAFKTSMYPPSQAGQPFEWSSDKQRRAFFATDGFGRGIPTQRTYELATSGEFIVEKKFKSLYITYTNIAPYFQWVQGQFSQIIGHIRRGWKPVNTFVVDNGKIVRERFDAGIKGAWDRMKK